MKDGSQRLEPGTPTDDQCALASMGQRFPRGLIPRIREMIDWAPISPKREPFLP
jgi:hypothetical protein